MTHGIEATCASPRWRPNPEIDWHRDRYPRDMINPAGRNHVIRQRSPSLNAIKRKLLTYKYVAEHNNNIICMSKSSSPLHWVLVGDTLFLQCFGYLKLYITACRSGFPLTLSF